MMTPVLFTFQIILLAIGFGIGYLFLVKSKSQENNLKTTGEILGWILIAATVILEILNFSYSINIVSNSVQKIYLPIESTSTTQPDYIHQQGVPGMTTEDTQGKPVTNEDDNNVQP